jgi:hypothetical protein
VHIEIETILTNYHRPCITKIEKKKYRIVKKSTNKILFCPFYILGDACVTYKGKYIKNSKTVNIYLFFFSFAPVSDP